MSRNRPGDERMQRLQQAVGPNYRIEELIGEGGMANVYRAVALKGQLGGKIAIKLLKAELARDPNLVNRFVNEAKLQARLTHPNIVWVFDIGQHEDLHYFFMPFIEGEDLQERMRRVPLDSRQTLDVAIQITNALECAHAAGVVHRDLKPSNIRFRTKDQLVVMDFGIARVRSAHMQTLYTMSQLSSLNVPIGTPPWMSPEQWQAGQPGIKEVDARTDLYSLGVILYELIARHNPFFGADTNETRKLHITYTPPSLMSIIPDMNPGLSRIVERLLAKDPDDRFPNATELLEELRVAVVDRGVTPAPPGGLLIEGLSAIPHSISDQLQGRQLTPNERHMMEFVDGIRTVEEVLTATGWSNDEAQRVFGLLRKDAVWLDFPLRVL